MFLDALFLVFNIISILGFEISPDQSQIVWFIVGFGTISNSIFF